MSMLSWQCDGLREAAGRLEGYQNGEISRMLREAADTITSLWNSLAASEAALNKATVLNETRYQQLFGTPERAARTMALMCECSPECSFCLLQGRAVSICNNGDRDALLEWLRGDA